jgi:hypothetical protein
MVAVFDQKSVETICVVPLVYKDLAYLMLLVNDVLYCAEEACCKALNYPKRGQRHGVID